MTTLSPATHALFGAIATNDQEGVREALEDGADPTALGHCEGLKGGLPALHLACMMAEHLDCGIVEQLLDAGAPTADAGQRAAIQGDAMSILLHRLASPRVVRFLQRFATHKVPSTPAHLTVVLLHAPFPGQIAALDVLWDLLPVAHRASVAMETLLARWLAVHAHRQRDHRPDPLMVAWLLDHGSRLDACATPTTPPAQDFLERAAPESLSLWQARQRQHDAFEGSCLAQAVAPWLKQALEKGRQAPP